MTDFMRQGLPLATKGMVIGLLGGSFDPAHQGHVHISHEAIKRMGLDQVWWLVSPGNPLKPRPPAEISRRKAEARRQLRGDPRVIVTDIESRLGTKFTADTIKKLQKLYPQVHFIWLMGADNLASFHLWQRWREIVNAVPIGVLARPQSGLRAQLSPMAQIFKPARLRRAAHLAHAHAPAWAFVNLPMHKASSTAIRAAKSWR